ncbi:MAG: T9SS type A sorting domain-containing protein [Bacteroidales bacterium]
MKKLIVILALIFPFISINSYSQTWAPIGATWTYTETFASSYEVDPSIVTSVKDTIINSINCKKMQYMIWTCNYSSNYMYDDSDRVFFYDATSSRFNLLYDFNKHSGETWYIKVDDYHGNDSSLVHVDSTSTVVINGNILKVLYTTIDASAAGNWEGLNGKITEKLGHEKFMFPLINGLCDEEFNYGLRCYEDSTIGLYQTGIAPSCDYSTVGINEYLSNEGFNFSPNPASSEIQVISNQSTVIGIDIYNMLGEKIYSLPPTDYRSPASPPASQQGGRGEPITINVSAFPSGMYFVEIKSEKGVAVKKFIKE